MSKPPDLFRNYGLLPTDAVPPAGPVRSYLSAGQVFGQYLFTAIMAGFGLGIGTLFALTLSAPLNVAAAAAIVMCAGYVVWFATRHDYAWVELDGRALRAKHLYTRRVVERSVDDVADLLTLVVRVRTEAVVLAEAWLGRVRGVEVRFRDGRTPLRVNRSDPAMRNARELIQAIIYRLAEGGGVDAEIINLDGAPMVRRIYRTAAPAAAAASPSSRSAS